MTIGKVKPHASHASWGVDPGKKRNRERESLQPECLTLLIWTVACERVEDLRNHASLNF